jgi:hypothetical protein
MSSRKWVVAGLATVMTVAIGIKLHAQTFTSGTSSDSASARTEPITMKATDMAAVQDLSEAELAAFISALDATPQISYDAIPNNGISTYYSLQHPDWAPLPANLSHSPVWQMDHFFLLDDIYHRYPTLTSVQTKTTKSGGTTTMTTLTTMTTMDTTSPPSPGDGTTNTYVITNSISYTTPDYGTNLYLAQVSLENGYFTAIASNTLPDVQYEIQTNADLTTTNWGTFAAYPFFYGSPETNWTQLDAITVNPGLTNLFLRLRSGVSSDGSGLPDWWEQKYGVTDPYGDSDGDGWNNLQEFQNGTSPTNFDTPPTPQCLTASLHQANGTATIDWLPSPGDVTSYTLEKSDSYTYPPTVQTINVSANVTSFADDISGNSLDPWNGDSYDVSYRLQANYNDGHHSPWTQYIPLQPTTVSASITRGPNEAAQLVISGIPANATAVRLFFLNTETTDNGDTSYNYDKDIPASSSINGTYSLPAAWQPPVTNVYGYPSRYNIYAKSIDVSSNASGATITTSLYGGSTIYNWGQQFYDGRVEMKQNLIFHLRAAPADGALHFRIQGTGDEVLGPYGGIYAWPTNYAYSGLYQFASPPAKNSYYSSREVDPYWPFEENYLLRNLAFQASDVDSNGNLTTGVGLGFNYGDYVEFYAVPTYRFQTNWTGLPAVLGTNYTRWTFYDQFDSSDNVFSIGLVDGEDASPNGYTLTLASSYYNWFGLPYVSMLVAGQSYPDHNFVIHTNYAGQPYTSMDYYNQPTIYPETGQPQFRTQEYDFWEPYIWNETTQSYIYQLPGDPSFSPSNQSQLLITPVGNPYFRIAGYAKLEVTNSAYTGVYGYLGQYFDQAYQIDENGNVTTNTTGVLSPYGNFFATEPGPTALVTMPDIDTGERGTCTVYSVSLVLDKNHDGKMDGSFNGPDATTQASPMIWWINDDYDYSGASWDLGHDAQPSWYYNDGYQQKIDSQRDLEDYARLWICGMPALTNGNYQVTLSWANVSSGNPTINLFDTVETNGGIGYLTNLDTATAEAYNYGIWGENRTAIATISPSQSFTFPANYFTNTSAKYFLFDGAITNGAGELVLTIADSNGNTIAQSGAWLDLHDVKDFYERAVITNDISSSAISNWTSSIEQVQPAVASALGDDTNLIVLVHGINVGNADWLIESDTVFKRLYWAGYRGKFMTVKWPCNYLTPPQPLTFDVFNLSEAKAYKASTALTTYLNQLRSRFSGYQLNLFVHSQGNAVVSEAIKNGAPYDTYILTQGALPDNCYDVNATNYPDFIAQEVGTHITPEWQPMGYRGIYTNSNFTGRIINFYNPQDGVLAIWQTDQIDDKPSGYYSYDGTNCWYTDFFFISHLVTDFQETRSMVSRSRSLSIGQSGPASAHGVIQSAVDLNAQFGFNSAIAEHSAQWARPIQTSLPYYSQVLLQIKPLQ